MHNLKTFIESWKTRFLNIEYNNATFKFSFHTIYYDLFPYVDEKYRLIKKKIKHCFYELLNTFNKNSFDWNQLNDVKTKLLIDLKNLKKEGVI